jgi:hypothetical protein
MRTGGAALVGAGCGRFAGADVAICAGAKTRHLTEHTRHLPPKSRPTSCIGIDITPRVERIAPNHPGEQP